MSRSIYVFALLILMLAIHFAAAFELYPGLVVNYSDFSHVSSVAAGDQFIYFGTTHGITRYDKINDRWIDPLTSLEGFYDRRIFEVRASFDDQSLWVKTDLGNYEYNETLKEWRPIDDFPADETQARHLAPDPFYFAPWGFNYMTGGYLVDDFGREFRMTDILDDNWSNLWIGIWGLGAAWADIDSRRIELMPYGPLHADITSLCVMNDELWMGGLTDSAFRTGLTVFDRSDNEFDYVQFSDENRFLTASIYGLYGGEERLLAATEDGIWIIDPVKRKFVERLSRRDGIPDNRVLCVLTTADYLLAGTEYGLGIIDMYSDTSDQTARVMMSALTVLCLEKAGGNIWIGTDNGVYRWNPSRGKFGRLTAGALDGFWIINDLYHDGRVMWVAGENELASIDLETADIETYPEVLNYGGVRAVATRDTLIAVATGYGLLMIYNGERRRHQLFNMNDGLISDDIRDLLFDDEYLWLATDRGLTRFWFKNPAL